MRVDDRCVHSCVSCRTSTQSKICSSLAMSSRRSLSSCCLSSSGDKILLDRAASGLQLSVWMNWSFCCVKEKGHGYGDNEQNREDFRHGSLPANWVSHTRTVILDLHGGLYHWPVVRWKPGRHLPLVGSRSSWDKIASTKKPQSYGSAETRPENFTSPCSEMCFQLTTVRIRCHCYRLNRALPIPMEVMTEKALPVSVAYHMFA